MNPAPRYRMRGEILQRFGQVGRIMYGCYIMALICRTGHRSAQMQQTLAARGFTLVYSVADGMAGAGWIKRGLPVTQCKGC